MGCGLPGPLCGTRARSGGGSALDAGFLGMKGDSLVVTLSVPTPTATCERGIPKRADVKVTDPVGDEVAFEQEFLPGPEDAPEDGKVHVTFTPVRAGWHDVSVHFEPGWGGAQAVGYVFLAQSGAMIDLPASADGGGCADLTQTPNGWLCGDTVFLNDGGTWAFTGQVRAAGHGIWVYSSPKVAYYDTRDGGLTLMGSVSLTGSPAVADQLLATENELLALAPSGSRSTLVRYRSSALGVTQENVLSTEDAGMGSYGSARLLFQQGDTVFVARQLSGVSINGDPPDFMACGFSSTAPGLRAPVCATHHGALVGTSQGGLFSFSEKDRTLRFFSPEGELLLPRTNLAVPLGTRHRNGAGGSSAAASVNVSQAPTFENQALGRSETETYLLTPRVVPDEGIQLELFRFGVATPQGANGRFAWGAQASPARVRVHTRAP